MSKYVFDLETNELLYGVTKIHCAVLQDMDTDVQYVFHNHPEFDRDGPLGDGLLMIQDADLLAGHNICQYDKPVLEKLVQSLVYNKQQILLDTLSLSRLLFPDRFEHSIESWAKSLKTPQQKVQNEDWTEISSNMITRCKSDVAINTRLLRHFQNITNKHNSEGTNWLVPLFTEQRVAAIHAKQTQVGVNYNVELAKETMLMFDEKMNVLREIIMREAPPFIHVPGTTIVILDQLRHGFSEEYVKGVHTLHKKRLCNTVEKPFRKDGKVTQAVIKWIKEPGIVATVQGKFSKWEPLEYVDHLRKWFKDDVPEIKGPFCKVEFLPMNPNSDPQIKTFLKGLGWIPDEWNTKRQDDGSYLKTSPKLSKTSFGSLPDGLGKTVVDYRCLKHRRGLIQSPSDPTKGALAKVRGDGRVSADAITCGTPTSRYRHSGAVCNIPRPSSPWGSEIRSLFGVNPLYWLVGIDLSGIEARMLANYCYRYDGGPEFARLILTKKDGGWHSANAELWNTTRELAKEHLYALMYGAGPTKLGNILGEPVKVGSRNRDAFMNAYTPYADLLVALEESIHKNGGYLVGLDGRRFYIRNKKDALNTLLQGNSAIIFKNWMIELENIRKESPVPIEQIIAYHDETQNEVQTSHEQIAINFGEKACEAAVEVGISFNLNVPLAADFKVGKTWADTH